MHFSAKIGATALALTIGFVLFIAAVSVPLHIEWWAP